MEDEIGQVQEAGSSMRAQWTWEPTWSMGRGTTSQGLSNVLNSVKPLWDLLRRLPSRRVEETPNHAAMYLG